jgi:glycosyltransferase involved in cell wall biosynthesis
MADQRPLVSIAIPCYNYARYVGEAIASALAQTYDDCEVVVVNDGSTDDSLRVIRRFSDRVTVIDQPNQGLSEAYNACLRASHGSIVLFLDADDLLEPDVVARAVECWSPTCVKVQYDLKIVDAEGHDLGRRFCQFPPGYDARRVRDDFRRTGTYRWPVTTGNAYARWFVDAVFPMRDHMPDGLLNTLAPLYGDVITLREPLGSYRIHQTNTWSNTGSDERRLPDRIHRRRREVAALRERARDLGIDLPLGDVLDHEIAFVNYRLQAWRLGIPYDQKERDAPARLLKAGLRLTGDYPPPLALTQTLWLCALFAAPPGTVKLLFAARAQRSRWRRAAHEQTRALREKLSEWRLRGTSDAPSRGASSGQVTKYAREAP